MEIKPYSHIVEVNAEKRKILIYRLRDDHPELYTSIDIEDRNWNRNSDQYREFCRLLGEDILVDSPSARKIFRL